MVNIKKCRYASKLADNWDPKITRPTSRYGCFKSWPLGAHEYESIFQETTHLETQKLSLNVFQNIKTTLKTIFCAVYGILESFCSKFSYLERPTSR